MNEKTAKKLRKTARRAMTESPTLRGFTAHSKPVLDRAEELGATEKQARRALRLAAEELGRPVPGWAQRMVRPKFSREFVRVES